MCREDPNQILIHIRMMDNTAQLQQEAVGALGVNLIHGALTCKGDPNTVIEHLLDDLDRSRISVRALSQGQTSSVTTLCLPAGQAMVHASCRHVDTCHI